MDLKKQAVIHTGGNVVYLFALWVLTVITTWALGYDAVGDLTLAMAIGNVFFYVQAFGVRSFQSSDMAFEFSPEVYLRTRLLTVLLGMLLCLAACPLLGYSPRSSLAILLFLLFKTSETFSDVFFGDIQRQGRLEFAGYSLALRGTVTALMFSAAAMVFRTLNAALLAIAVGGALVTLLVDVPLYRKTVTRREKAPLRACALLMRKCLPLLLTTALPMVITALPRIALERFHGSETLGFYGNISTPGLMLTTVFPVVLTALLPGYGRRFANGEFQAIRRTWSGTLFAALLSCGAGCLGVWLLGKPVLSIIYTQRIQPYIHYLYYILVATTLYAMTCCNAAVLASMRQNRVLTVTVLLAFLLCTTTTVPLVKCFGINGAITVLVIAYGAQCAVQAGCIELTLHRKKVE